jgi:hypothetical protein
VKGLVAAGPQYGFAQPLEPEDQEQPSNGEAQTPKGIARIAGPSTATTATRTSRPVSAPVIAERQSRAVPAARMIVTVSTASTKHARYTAMKSADPVTNCLTSG